MLQAHRAEELQVHLSFPGMLKANARLNTSQLYNIVVTEETVSVVLELYSRGAWKSFCWEDEARAK